MNVECQMTKVFRASSTILSIVSPRRRSLPGGFSLGLGPVERVLKQLLIGAATLFTLLGCSSTEVPSKRSLMLRIGPSPASVFANPPSEKTTYRSGETLVWLAIVGGTFFEVGNTLTIELVDEESSQTTLLYSDSLKHSPSLPTEDDPWEFFGDALAVPKQSRETHMVVRLRVGSAVRETHVVFVP